MCVWGGEIPVVDVGDTGWCHQLMRLLQEQQAKFIEEYCTVEYCMVEYCRVVRVMYCRLFRCDGQQEKGRDQCSVTVEYCSVL